MQAPGLRPLILAAAIALAPPLQCNAKPDSILLGDRASRQFVFAGRAVHPFCVYFVLAGRPRALPDCSDTTARVLQRSATGMLEASSPPGEPQDASASYVVLARKGNLFLTSTNLRSGGTAALASVQWMQLSERALVVTKHVAAGDRCDGSASASVVGNSVQVEISKTPPSILALSGLTLERSVIRRLRSPYRLTEAFFCGGIARFDYDPRAEHLQLVSLTLSRVDAALVDTTGSSIPDRNPQGCFDSMVLERMASGRLTLSAEELREFGRVFASTCIAPRTPAQIRSEREVLSKLVKRLIVDRDSLSETEIHRTRDLLLKPDVSPAIPFELGLEAIKLHHIDDNFAVGMVAGMTIARFKTDQRMIAFYRDLLRTQPGAAIGDLARHGEAPFDASFIMPILDVIGSVAPDKRNATIVGRALSYMDRHFEDWSRDTSVAHRLGQAVRRFDPSAVTNGMYVWLDWAGHTHDREMLRVLRPLLDDKTIERYTTSSANMPAFTTPMRYSELAANAICLILGEPIMFDPWRRARVDPSATAPYPEWAEWDKKVAALKLRLDRPETLPPLWR